LGILADSDEIRDGEFRVDALTPRRWLPLAVVGGLLAAAAIAASHATLGIHRVPPARDAGPTPGRGTAAHSATASAVSSTEAGRVYQGVSLPAWLEAAVGWVCAVLGVLLVGFLVWRAVQAWLSSDPDPLAAAAAPGAALHARRDAVLAAVDAGIAELASDDGDARSAVIACWVRLEDVAAVAGTPRGPGDTPGDLVARLLGEHQVSAPVLRSLADLYRAARYGTGVIDARMRADAATALGQLRDELARSRSGPLEYDPVEVGGRHAGPAGDRRGDR
jgi:hypothetical protein